jgi:cytochrome c biogenesis protein CcdA
MSRFLLALTAGGLAPINPCGFTLLPAFLSLQLRESSVKTSSRPAVVRGLTVAATVALGFIAVFVAVGLPFSLGASFLTRYIAWVGVVIGVALVGAGIWALTGRRLDLTSSVGGSAGRRSALAFGAGYGGASLGCTLPVFLSVVGLGAATTNPTSVLVAFGSYAIGTAATLIALGVAAARAQDSMARRLKRLIPHTHKITGALLVAAGGYVSYYWIRVETSGSAGTDPITEMIATVVAATERIAARHAPVVVASLLMIAAVAIVSAVRTQSRNSGRAR